MPKLTIKDGSITSNVYVKATLDYACDCGTESQVSINWPEGLIVNTEELNVTNAKCPTCGEVVSLPAGSYGIRDYKVVLFPK